MTVFNMPTQLLARMTADAIVLRAAEQFILSN